MAGRGTVVDIKGWKEYCGRYQGQQGEEPPGVPKVTASQIVGEETCLVYHWEYTYTPPSTVGVDLIMCTNFG